MKDKKTKVNVHTIDNIDYINDLKLMISDEIKCALKERNLSIRKLAENIGLNHPQIIRITSLKNYNIDTLLKILYGLDLEITVRKKQDEK